MRSMLKSALVALMAILAVSAVASASALASSPEWAVCASPPTGWSHGVRYATKGECEKEEHSGKTGEWEWGAPTETMTADTTGTGSQKFTIPDGPIVFECSALKGRNYYDKTEGLKNETTEAVFTGCWVTNPRGSCGYISSPGEPNGTIALSERLPSRLVTKEGVTYDEIEQNALGEIVTLEIRTSEKGGESCGFLSAISKLKGSMLAKVNGQNLEFEDKSGAKPLEINTHRVEYSGTETQELEGGGEIKVLEENYAPLPPEWEFKEGGKWKGLGASETRNIVVKQKENQVITVEKGTERVECEKMEGKGVIKAEGQGEESKRTYTGCKVTKPTECGVIHSPGEPNGTIAFAAGLPTKLVAKESTTYDELEQNATKKEIASMTLETSTGSGKPCGVFKLNNKLKGSMLATVNNLAQEFDFEGKSGSKPLEMNTLSAEYNGKEHVELEGGGEVRAS